MQVWNPVPERLDVHFQWSEYLVCRCGNLGHFGKVKIADGDLQVEHLSNALLGGEEQAAPEILVWREAHVAGLQPSNEPRIGAMLGVFVLPADRAICHAFSMTDLLASIPHALAANTYERSIGGGRHTDISVGFFLALGVLCLPFAWRSSAPEVHILRPVVATAGVVAVL
jgi:hypothetical protein